MDSYDVMIFVLFVYIYRIYQRMHYIFFIDDFHLCERPGEESDFYIF